MTEHEGGTFVFADIAGYTALTEAHGDADAAELAGTFCREMSQAARSSGGEVIKTIGDAVMVRHVEPSDAVLLGLTAAHDVMAGHGFPAVRVGMHHGPAIRRGDDWFGATVNLAARVAGVAAGGEVLVTDAVRDGAGGLESVEFQSRGHHRMRNVAALVPIYVAVADERSADSHDVDPVCRMLVAEGREAGTLRHARCSIASARTTAPASSSAIRTRTRRPSGGGRALGGPDDDQYPGSQFEDVVRDSVVQQTGTARREHHRRPRDALCVCRLHAQRLVRIWRWKPDVHRVLPCFQYPLHAG